MDFALRVAVAANVSSLAILEYGLAPGLQHPGQLVQAVEALRHLLRSTGGGHTGYAAKDIFLFGDSAGGNLVAGVLAHLKYTSPYTQAIELSDHLGGAVMLSPWVSMRHDGDSYISNVTMDTIDVAGGLESKEKWKPKVGDRFADMLCETNAINIGPDNVKGFWTGVFQGGKRVVDKALILAGGDEIILDDVMAFGKIAGAAERLAGRAESAGDDGSVVLLHCPGETHCGAILDVIAGVEVEGGMLAGIIKWLSKIRCE
jgi:acetyl esterase/lipase